MIIQQGAFEVLNSVEGYVRNLTVNVNVEAGKLDNPSPQDKSKMRRISPTPNLDGMNDLARRTGDFSVYKYYLGFAGYHTFFFALIILAIYSFCLVFPSKIFLLYVKRSLLIRKTSYLARSLVDRECTTSRKASSHVSRDLHPIRYLRRRISRCVLLVSCLMENLVVYY
jgi:hypothetical protein